MLRTLKLGACKLPMRHDPHLLHYVMLLRYGIKAGSEALTPVLNYQSIARLIRQPVTTVRKLVKAGVHASKYVFLGEAPRRSKLSHHHIGYLIAPETL